MFYFFILNFVFYTKYYQILEYYRLCGFNNTKYFDLVNKLQ